MKHLFGIVAVTVSSFIAAQGINFEKSSFETLLAKAKKEKKLVFVDAYAVWCGPCKLMDKNTRKVYLSFKTNESTRVKEKLLLSFYSEIAR